MRKRFSCRARLNCGGGVAATVPCSTAAHAKSVHAGDRRGPVSSALRGYLLLSFSVLPYGCAHVEPSLISLDGSQVNELSRVSLIIEDRDSPALLRGLDGAVPTFRTMRVPGVFSNYAYVMAPGPHVLWIKGMPWASPYALLPQRIRCYTMKATLAPGERYYLKEDEHAKKVFLLREDAMTPEASGELVDEPWGFLRECRWQ